MFIVDEERLSIRQMSYIKRERERGKQREQARDCQSKRETTKMKQEDTQVLIDLLEEERLSIK